MLENKEIMLVQNEDGTFSQYDDSNDITTAGTLTNAMTGKNIRNKSSHMNAYVFGVDVPEIIETE